MEPACATYVMDSPIARSFMETFRDLILSLIPYYGKEGKGRLTIGIGCTGGQHRSVAVAEELGRQLAQRGVRSQVRHREITDRKLAVDSGRLRGDAGDECDTGGAGEGNNGKVGDSV